MARTRRTKQRRTPRLEKRRERERTRTEFAIDLLKTAVGLFVTFTCGAAPWFIGIQGLFKMVSKAGFEADHNPFLATDKEGIITINYFKMDVYQLTLGVINAGLIALMAVLFWSENRRGEYNVLTFSPFYPLLFSACIADAWSVFVHVSIYNWLWLRQVAPFVAFYLTNAADMVMGIHRLLILAERFSACAWPTFHHMVFNSKGSLARMVAFCWWFGYGGNLMLFSIRDADREAMVDRAWLIHMYNDVWVMRWVRRCTVFFTGVVMATHLYGFVLLVLNQIYTWYEDYRDTSSKSQSGESQILLATLTKGVVLLAAFMAPFMTVGMFWFSQFAYGYIAMTMYPILLPVVAWRYWQFYKAKTNMSHHRSLLDYNFRLTFYAFGATGPFIFLYYWLDARYIPEFYGTHELYHHDFHWFFIAEVVHGWCRTYCPLGVIFFSDEIRTAINNLRLSAVKLEEDELPLEDEMEVQEHQVPVNQVRSNG